MLLIPLMILLSLFHLRKRGIRRIRIFKVFSGNRRVASIGLQANGSTVENTQARSEIDNHADTCCFGANFTPLYFTDQVCDVSPFSDAYDSMTNITLSRDIRQSSSSTKACGSVLHYRTP
jgi:hypothetical protein